MSKRKKRDDWNYPPNYNHLLGYVEGGKAYTKRMKKDAGFDPVVFDRSVKDGRSLNK